MDLNWNSPDAFEVTPGIYRAGVKTCEGTMSKNGDPMLKVGLVALDWGHMTLVDDYIMLGGKGMRFGLPRLVALGIAKGTPNFEPADLVGRQVYVAIHWEEYVKRDGTPSRSLRVNVKAEDSHCGYWPVASPPSGVRKPEQPIPEPAPIEETPF